MAGVHHHRLAVDLPRLLDVVPVVLALGVELHRGVADPRAAPVDDHVVDEGQVADRLLHRRLQADLLAAPVAVVRADHHLGVGVLDPRLEALGAHARVDHRVDRPDPGAGQHGDDRLGGERHVQDHPVAGLDAEPLQRVGEAVHLPVQPVVGVGALLAVLAHPQQGGLVAAVAVDVAVDAVDGGVELAADEPGVVGRLELHHRAPRLGPVQGARLLRPEGVRVLLGEGALRLVVDAALPGQPAARRDGRLALEQGLDVGLLGYADLHPVGHGASGLPSCGGGIPWFYRKGTLRSSGIARTGRRASGR